MKTINIEIEENANNEDLIKFDKLVFGKEKEMLKYSMAPCCSPIPGDNVFGFISVKDGIKVHSKNCPNSISLRSNYAYRIISATWINSDSHEFNAKIEITGIDDIVLLTVVAGTSVPLRLINLFFSM